MHPHNYKDRASHFMQITFNWHAERLNISLSVISNVVLASWSVGRERGRDREF